jgi:hypothetical protein
MDGHAAKIVRFSLKFAKYFPIENRQWLNPYQPVVGKNGKVGQVNRAGFVNVCAVAEAIVCRTGPVE